MKNTIRLFSAVALGGFAMAQGADDCSMATAISGMGPFLYDTIGATTDGVPDALCSFAGNDDVLDDVWFSWTAADDGPHILSLCANSSGDSRVAVYGATCGSGILACDDDGCAGLLSETTFNATNGQTYLIRIGNYSAGGGSTGEFTVRLDAPIFNPANGHYYEVVSENLSWPDARAAAEARIWQGQPGYLATITDQAELDWIIQNVAPSRPWIGLFQNTSSPNYSEPAGGFEWVTGEPVAFTNFAPGEPNDTSGSGGAEDYIEMFGNGQWNDAEENHSFTFQYLVEWGAGGGFGTNYCMPNANSTGGTGSMSASGSIVAANNDLTLMASGLPQVSFGFFITSQTQGFVPNPAGSEGNLCLGGAIGRYVAPGQIMNSGGNGEIVLTVDTTQTPQPNGLVTIQSGETWNFQLWHRDVVGGMAVSNFTDGLQIDFI